MTLPPGMDPNPNPDNLTPDERDQLMTAAAAEWRKAQRGEGRTKPTSAQALAVPLQAVGAVLHAPQQAVQSLTGPLLQAAIEATDKIGLQPPSRVTEMQARQAKGQSPFEAAVDTVGPLTLPGPGATGLTHPISLDPAALKVAAETATDPLTYLGGGYGALARQGTALATKLLPQGPQLASLAQTFSRIEQIDRASIQLPWQALSAGGAAARDLIGSIPVFGTLKVVDAAGNETPVRTIGEWALGQWSHGRFIQRVRELADTAANALQHGSLLEHFGIQDLFSAPSNITPYTTTTNATKALDLGLQTLHQEAQAATDPHAQLLANELLAQTDKALTTIQDKAQAEILHHARIPPIGYKSGGAPLYPPPVEKKITAALQTAHDEATQTVLSARYLLAQIIQDPARFANGKLPDITDPALLSQLEGVRQTAATSIAQAVQQTGQTIRTGLPYNPLGGPRFAAQLARNQTITQAYDTARNAFGSILEPTNPTTGVQTLTDLGTRLGGNLQDIRSMGQAVLRNEAPITAVLPARLAGVAQREWGPIRTSYESLLRAQNTVEDALKEAWARNDLTAKLPYPAQPISTLPAQRYPQVNALLQQMGKQPVENFPQLVKSIRGDLTPQTGNKLLNIADHWVGDDLLSGEPYKLIVDEVARAYARQYGITNPGALETAIRDATALFKEQALHSPAYPISNLLSGLLAGKFEGIPAGQVLTHLSENAGDAISGNPVVNSGLRTAARIWELAVPDAVKSSAGLMDVNAVREAARRGITASARIGSAKLGLGMAGVGAVAGAVNPLTPEDQRAQSAATGALVGGAYGLAWPTMTKYLLTRLGGGLEATMRQDAYLFGTSRTVAAQAPELAARVDAALQQTTPQITAGPLTSFYRVNPNPTNAPFSAANPRTLVERAPIRQVAQVGVAPTDAAQAAAMIRQANGMIGPSALRDALVSAGAPEQAAQDVASWWRTQLDLASRDGLALVDRVHVDYQNLTNIEALLRSAVPFSTWSIRMTPFFLQHILERPAILFTLLHLNEVGQQLIDERGLSQRFTGSLPLGLGDAVLSSLMGRPVQAWYNILKGIMPFSGAAQGLTQSPSEQTEPFLQQAYKMATSFGPSLHPALEAVMRSTLFETDQPARGPFRLGEPLFGLTGVDLNAAPVQLERLARQGLRGRLPADVHQQAVQRRIDELALQETGHAIGDRSADVAPYIAAKSTQSGPIWDRALAQANRERAVRGGIGYLAQPLAPQAIISPEESSIRAARTPTEQGGNYIQFPIPVDQQMQQAMASGKGQSPATPLMIAATRDYAERILGQSYDSAQVMSRNRITPVGAFFQVGTISALYNLRSALSDVQTQINSLTRGYQTGGSPEELKLESLLATYSNPAALLRQAMPNLTPQDLAAFQQAWQQYQTAPDPLRARMAQSREGPMALVRAYTTARDQYATANPLLAQYLAWQQANPGAGSKEFFLRSQNQK